MTKGLKIYEAWVVWDLQAEVQKGTQLVRLPTLGVGSVIFIVGGFR